MELLEIIKTQLTEAEKVEHHIQVGKRLLQQRYRYYYLDNPVLNDFEYDVLERYYEALSAYLGLEPINKNLVGFDENEPNCIEAKIKVDLKLDDYSLWEEGMQPIWNRLGRPHKFKEKEEV